MLTIGIRYLTGSVVASDVSNRGRVEWPPHPGRVFMALAAAHFQTGEDGAERAALEWLETLPAPQIHAALHSQRSAVTHYVPVNDTPGPSKAPLQSAPGLTRDRQPRNFARAWLEDDTASLVWPGATPERHLAALGGLCSKVTRVGHTASLVQMWASESAPDKPANWLPEDDHATTRLRVPGPGSLGGLERRFNREEVDAFFELKAVAADGSDKGRRAAAPAELRERFHNQPPVRLRPEMSLSCGYATPLSGHEPAPSGTVFDPRLLVYALRRVDGPYRHLDLVATLQLTTRLREAVLQHLGADAPESLSGHRGEGRSERPHLAFVPLASVGHEHAHGGILGVALAAPRDLPPADRQRLLRALAALREEGLKLGPLGRWALDTPETSASPATLRDRLWTAVPEGSRLWATVTPYVFDRHPKAKDGAAFEGESLGAIRDSWDRVRQSPEVSAEAAATPVSAHPGAPPSHQFPRLARKDGSECRHTHAILIFDRPVVGPILLGAGRYRGYGLCRPL